MAKVIFKQNNKKAGIAKMKALVGNPIYGAIGFCDFQLIKDFSSHVSREDIEQNPHVIDYYERNGLYNYVIEATTTYHTESTIKDMYKTNGKKW